MALFWWLVANTLLPVLLPFLVLLPWKLGRGHPRYDKRTEADTSIGAAVKDGQFCLIAIAISVASIHEVLTVRGALPPWLVSTSVAQGGLCAIALMIYTLSMFFRVDVDLTKSGNAWLQYYFFGTISIFLCALVGGIAIWNHAGVTSMAVLVEAGR